VVLKLISALFQQFLLLVNQAIYHQRGLFLQYFLPNMRCSDLLAIFSDVVCYAKSFELRVCKNLLSNFDLYLLEDQIFVILVFQSIDQCHVLQCGTFEPVHVESEIRHQRENVIDLLVLT